MWKLLLILLFSSISFYGQKKIIKGFVSDSLKKALVNATILVKDKFNNYSYGLTDKNGKYLIALTAKTDTIFIEARSIGYETFKKKIVIKDDLILDLNLKIATEKLKEIIIESKRKILINKDTVTYNLSKFTDKSEETLEDVLRKLPGLDISENGNIKFNGKSIEKILIEGEDLVSKNYTILSKNLDAALLKNVQVLRNYDDNPLKKRFSKSGRVALNLSIKEAKKNILFGAVKAGLGSGNHYNLQTNFGLLKKKIKLLSLGKFNNNGFLAGINSNNLNDDFNLNIDNFKEPYFNTEANKSFSNVIGYLKEEESVLNKTKGNSLTLSSKLSATTTLRVLTYYNTDEIEFDKFSTNVFNLKNNPISIVENRFGKDVLKDFSNNIEVKFFNQGNWYLTFESKLKTENNNWTENLFTDVNLSTSLANNFKNSNLYFFNHFKATYYPMEHFIWENYFYQTHSKLNENFETSASRFDFETEKPINQFVDKENNFIGWKSKASYQLNRNQFQLETLFEKENYLFKNSINSDSNVSLLYQNNSNQSIYNLGSQISYSLELNKDKLTLTYGNFFKNIEERNNFNQGYFLPSAKINYNFDLKKIGKLSVSYNHKKDLLNTDYFFNGLVLKNYRSANRQIRKIEKSNINTFGVSHSIQKLDTGFLTFTVSSLSFFDKSLIVDSDINSSSTTNNFTFINKDSFLFFLQNETTQYFSSFKTSLKLKNNFTLFSNYLFVNNSALEQLKNYSFNIKLSGTTYFKSLINFQFYFRHQKDWSQFQNTTSTVDNYIFNLTSKYSFNKEWFASATFNRYNLNNNFQDFLSGELNFKPNKSKFNYKLQILNLLDENSFDVSQINDFQSYTSQSRIIPRYIMVTITMRF